MNVLSLFDGMSCGRVALERAGIPIDMYISSEIKSHAVKVADLHFPQDSYMRMGDVTKIRVEQLPPIDLLIGGSPCQDFSGANRNRLGVKGEKSGLFYEYVRLLNECKPKYFLLENVRMKKEHQDIISNELGCEPIVINSNAVAPQLRHRVYWTNIPILELTSNDIKLNDVLLSGYSDRDKARCLLESDSRPGTTPIKMVHRYFNKGFTTLIFKDEQHYKQIKKHFDTYFKGWSAKEIDYLHYGMDLSIYNGVRYMDSREREACQTVPLGYTDSLSWADSACLLGDGWTVDVIAHIFKGLLNES